MSKKIVDFENEKLVRGLQKLWKNYENASDYELMISNYKHYLFYYTVGQAGSEYCGTVRGMEQVMLYTMGIDFIIKLREEVLQEIKEKGREIVNDYFFSAVEDE